MRIESSLSSPLRMQEETGNYRGLESEECTPAYNAKLRQRTAYIAKFTTEHLRIIGKFSNTIAPSFSPTIAVQPRFATRVVLPDLLQPLLKTVILLMFK